MLILLALWYFGFLSFHSREKGKAIERLADVQTALKKSQIQLAELTSVIDQMKRDASDLETRRSSLESQRAVLADQVSRLGNTRDRIALSLEAASQAVRSSSTGRVQAYTDSLFAGILGNVIAAPIVFVLGFIFGPRAWRAIRSRLRRSPDLPIA